MHIDTATLSSLRIALDAASVRHTAIATNIANVDTSGFVPVRPSFDVALDAAMPSSATGSPARLRLVHRGAPAAAAGANDVVRLDQEMAALSQNAIHYQALVKVVNGVLALNAAAVTEGRR